MFVIIMIMTRAHSFSW